MTDPQVAQRVQQLGGAYGRVLTDPALRQAQGASLLSQQVTREANILAFNDVFLLIAAHGGGGLRLACRALAVPQMDRDQPAGGGTGGAPAHEAEPMTDVQDPPARPDALLDERGGRSSPSRAGAAGGSARDADRGALRRRAAGPRPAAASEMTSLFVALLLGGALLALYAWGLPPFSATRQTTDNAYVRGQTTIIAPQVNGYVTKVFVQDFQDVTGADRPLVAIDDRIYRQRVAAGAGEPRRRRSPTSTIRRRASGRARHRSAGSPRRWRARGRSWCARRPTCAGWPNWPPNGSVSLRERDQTLAALRQAEAAVRPGAGAAARSRRSRSATVTVGRGGLEAAVENAARGADAGRRSTSPTPSSARRRPGRSAKSACGSGSIVTAGTQLLFLVPRKVWVVANFKEAQTARIAAGPAARPSASMRWAAQS